MRLRLPFLKLLTTQQLELVSSSQSCVTILWRIAFKKLFFRNDSETFSYTARPFKL